MSKNVDTFKSEELDIPIGDRLNLCYASTVVTKGRGSGVIIATGMNTQVCEIIGISRRSHSPALFRLVASLQ